MPETTRGQMPHQRSSEEVAVYQLISATGALLYVGISKDPMNRWLAYRETSWWPEVDQYAVDWYPSREKARAVEKEFLAADLAECNVHSTPRHGDHQRRQRAAGR